MADAKKRFSPNFRTAFEAWQATNPETNPAAPPGPTYMPQYRQPAKARAAALNAQASVDYAAGEKAGANSDDYVRTTVFLATVLFLAGIGSHFGYRAIRYGLAGVASGDPGVRHRAAGHGAEAIFLSRKDRKEVLSMLCSQAKTQQFGRHRRGDSAGTEVEQPRRPTNKGRCGALGR